MTMRKMQMDIVTAAEFQKMPLTERAIIADALKSRPLGPSQIAKACGMRAVNVRQLLLKMKKAGEVNRTAYGQYTACPDTRRGSVIREEGV